MNDEKGNRLCDYVNCKKILDVGIADYFLGFYINLALCREHYILFRTISHPPKKENLK